MALSLKMRAGAADVTVVEISGRITLGRESKIIESEVLRAVESGARKLVFDLRQVDYIDSAGIGILAYCFGKVARAGGAYAVAGARGLVGDVFQITRLHEVVRLFDDEASACASLSNRGNAAMEAAT